MTTDRSASGGTLSGTVVGALVFVGIQLIAAFTRGMAILRRGRVLRRVGALTVAAHRARAGGAVLVVAAVALAVVAYGLASLRPWARVAALATEAVWVVGAVVRLAGRRPGGAVVALVFGLVVIGLLLTPSAQAALARRPPPPSEVT